MQLQVLEPLSKRLQGWKVRKHEVKMPPSMMSNPLRQCAFLRSLKYNPQFDIDSVSRCWLRVKTCAFQIVGRDGKLKACPPNPYAVDLSAVSA